MDNQRLYQRGNHWDGRAKVSRDARCWERVYVVDVSSGGMHFCVETEFEKGESIWVDLTLGGFFSEIDIKVKGIIRRKASRGKNFCYGLAFVELAAEKQVQIDENIRNDRPVEGGGYEVD